MTLKDARICFPQHTETQKARWQTVLVDESV